MCDTHKFFQQEVQLTRIRSNRVGLHSDFIDLNRLKKQRELEDAESRIGAFNKKGGFRSREPQLSPRSQAKLDA